VEFEKGNGMVKPELLEERIFNSITWAPRIWVGPLGQSIWLQGQVRWIWLGIFLWVLERVQAD